MLKEIFEQPEAVRNTMRDRVDPETGEIEIPELGLKDRDLVGLLLQLDLEQQIPAELYVAVAEILCYLYRVNERWKARPAPRAPRAPEHRPAGDTRAAPARHAPPPRHQKRCSPCAWSGR